MRSWMVLCALPLALAAGLCHGQADSPEKASNPWFKARPLAPPNVPALTAFVTPSGNHGLNWTRMPDAEGYRVFRSVDGKTFTEIADLKEDNSTLTDRDPAARAGAFYRVRAYNAAGATDSNSTFLREATVIRSSHLGAAPKAHVRRQGGAGRNRGVR